MKPAARIIWVSLVFYPDTSAAGQLFTDLFTGLAACGARVTVLCGFPAKHAPADVRTLPRKEIYRGVCIERCGPRIEGKRSAVARPLAYGGFLAHAGWRLLRTGRRAVIVGATDPPFTPIVLWALSFPGRFQYDCHMQDVYPDGLVRLGMLSASSPVTRVWRALNGLSLRRARRVIVIGRDMAELISRDYGVPEDRIVYVPAWAPSELDAHPAAAGDIVDTVLHSDDRFLVQYSGNMGLWHDMDGLVEAADKVRGCERIRFLFTGRGMRRAQAEHLSTQLGLRNIVWQDFVPRESLPQNIAGADVELVSLRPCLEGIAVPSKIYGILAAGKPIIAQVPTQSEIARTVFEENCGVVVSPGDVDGLAATVTRLASDPALCREMGLRARAAYERRYTLQRALQKYAEIWLS